MKSTFFSWKYSIVQKPGLFHLRNMPSLPVCLGLRPSGGEGASFCSSVDYGGFHWAHFAPHCPLSVVIKVKKPNSLRFFKFLINLGLHHPVVYLQGEDFRENLHWFCFVLFVFLGPHPWLMEVLRCWIETIAAGLHHSNSNVGSELHLLPRQLMATLDP